MDLSPSWAATSCSATQGFSSNLSDPPLVLIVTQVNPVRTISYYHSKSYLNIVFTSTSRSSPCSPSSRFFHQNPICISLLPNSCYMPCPSHPPWLNHSNYIWGGVQFMKLLIMQLSPISCHLISLRTRYFPQHPVLRHPQSMFLHWPRHSSGG
jgi:hypothetical protein